MMAIKSSYALALEDAKNGLQYHGIETFSTVQISSILYTLLSTTNKSSSLKQMISTGNVPTKYLGKSEAMLALYEQGLEFKPYHTDYIFNRHSYSTYTKKLLGYMYRSGVLVDMPPDYFMARVPKQSVPVLLKEIYGRRLIPTEAHVVTLRLRNTTFYGGALDSSKNSRRFLGIKAVHEILESRIRVHQKMHGQILYRKLGCIDLVTVIMKKLDVGQQSTKLLKSLAAMKRTFV